VTVWQGGAVAYLLTAVALFVYAAIFKPEPESWAARILFCLLWAVSLPLFIAGSLFFDER
jgi:hypothetical protein